jgi:Tol biopolymer transport system component
MQYPLTRQASKSGLIGVVLITVLMLLPACRLASQPTSLPDAGQTATLTATVASIPTATPTPAPSSTFTPMPTALPTYTVTPPSPTPTHTSTPASTSTPTAWRKPWLIYERTDLSLWASALDGADPWPLTGPLTDTTDAIHWAPPAGGRWLAYIPATEWRTDHPAASLYVLDLESGAQKTALDALLLYDLHRSELPPDADVAVCRENAVVWHPDGTRLAFVSAHEGSADLHVYDRASDQVERLAGGVDNVFWPFWSPDGRFLLYHTAPRFGRRGSVPAGSAMWVVPARGGPTRRLTTGDRVEAVLGWMDGHHLVTLEQDASSFHDLALVDVTNGRRTLLLEGSIMQAAWSASAHLLAVVPYGNEQYTTGLWLVDPDNPEPILLDGEHGLLSPRWSPQEQYLIYGNGERCWLYDPRGRTIHDRPNTWCQGRWSPNDRYIAHVNDRLDMIDVETEESQTITSYPVHSTRWSPDGEWLVWLRLRESKEQRFDMLALRLGADEPIVVTADVNVEALWRLGWVQADMDVSTAAGLTVEEYAAVSDAVDSPPRSGMDYQSRVTPEMLEKRRVWRRGAVPPPIDQIVVDSHLVTVINVDPTPWNQFVVQVDGTTVYTHTVTHARADYPVKGLWAWQGQWVVELDGQVIVDGRSLNQALGYDEIFGWRLTAGKPFFFFRQDDQIGVSYDGQVLPYHYDDVVHYMCCEPALWNVLGNETMVWFHALRDGMWYYVEMGVYE